MFFLRCAGSILVSFSNGQPTFTIFTSWNNTPVRSVDILSYKRCVVLCSGYAKNLEMGGLDILTMLIFLLHFISNFE